MAGTSNAALLFDIQVQGNGYMSAFLPNQYWEGLRVSTEECSQRNHVNETPAKDQPFFNPFTAIMTSDDVLRKLVPACLQDIV